jgi:hypothetical protein
MIGKELALVANRNMTYKEIFSEQYMRRLVVEH